MIQTDDIVPNSSKLSYAWAMTKMVDVIDSDVLGMIGDNLKTLLSKIAVTMKKEVVRVEWFPKHMPFS